MQNNIHRYKICIVTLTYGNRQHLLKQVLARTLALPQVVKAVVVNNASMQPIASLLQDDRVTVLNNTENEGSAGGYHQGIKYAFEHVDCDFVWLLDDDNVPDENALELLLAQWPGIDVPDNKKALFCLRDDRVQHLRIARGEDPYRYYLVNDNFLGFHLFRIFINRYYKWRDRSVKQKDFKTRVKMPYVPYGGLLLHKKLIADIGYPKQDFFLYVDDSEYSYRITQNGGTIWLVPAAKVVDIDKSQGINYKKQFMHAQLLDEWSFRTYYHIRNRMYFYSRVAIKNKVMFGINKVIYLAYLYVISVLSNKTAQYKKLLVAVNDGLNGNLGKANLEKF